MSVGTLLPIFGFDLSQNLLPQTEHFFQWLQQTNQQYWQLLPINLGSPNEPCPYFSYSIGLLNLPDNIEIYDYEVDEFINSQPWAFNLSLHQYYSSQFQSDSWWNWPEEIKNRKLSFLTETTTKHYNQIKPHILKQAKNFKIWQLIKQQAHDHNIKIIGDLPFYIAKSSPLVWQYREAFEINSDGSTPFVSGVPESKTFPRQKWGHPLYDWNSPTTELLWQIRLKLSSQLFDITRIDHAIGFYHYGKMDDKDTNDLVCAGPSKNFFDRIVQYTKSLNTQLISEDLTDFDASRLRESLTLYNIPTMKVLTLSSSDNCYLEYYSCNPQTLNSQTIMYTSNHDSPTLLDWIEHLHLHTRQQLASLYDTDIINPNELATHIRNYLINKHQGITIIPIQDWVLTKDRINYPGQICKWELNPLLIKDLLKINK